MTLSPLPMAGIPEPEPIDIPANVVRSCPGGGGQYDVGLQFVLEA